MERREAARYASSGSVGGRVPGANADSAPVFFRGHITDLSNDGACVMIDRYLDPLKVLPFRFGFPDVPVLLPILGQVRWIEPSASTTHAFRVGLRFIA